MTKLTSALIERGLVTPEQMEDARYKQIGAKKPLHEVLLDMGFLSEEALFKAASEVFGVPVSSLESERIDPAAVEALPYEYSRKYGVFPLRKENSSLVVATGDPQNIIALDDLRSITGLSIKPVLALQSDISKYTEKYYQADESIYSLVKNIVEDKDKVEVKKESPVKPAHDPGDFRIDSSPVVRIVNLILSEAVKSRASDIHIEPFEKFTEVRYRVDGFLKRIMKLPNNMSRAIIARVKILAELDIAEKRKPQDGRIKISMGGNKIDLRVSSVPVFYGEKIVIRVLDPSQARVNIKDLGLMQEEFDLLKAAVRRTQGMILLTGPTGSGKTSTIYAALADANSETVNIITVEDPVEYQIEGINQIQVNPSKNLNFSNGLKSILRQDPDIIFVGEIRDYETAEMAFRSSLTGHLVFSTLHTNSASATVTRLKDIGIEPFLISSSLILVVAQRLVRVICPHCIEMYEPERRILEKYRLYLKKAGVREFYRGAGCEECGYSGFLGRTAIFEMLEFNEKIRELISKNATEAEILAEAEKNSFRTLAESGIMKVASRITTIEEVDRTTEMTGQKDKSTPPGDERETPRILIADDEEGIRTILEKRLLSSGYEVMTALNGREAVGMAFKEKPDLVIMDIMMPEMDGIQATRKLRESLETASIPVLMLTAKKDKRSELEGIDAGADDYMTKPFDRDKLLARIKMLLRRAG